jgi:RHS repeat-associated protein
LYFYHTDHLGSSSLVTTDGGYVTQHVEYVPFGEVFIEERDNETWSTPYKFNGKELDEETGLYYYGARYYDPRVSLWLGVDPLAEKYPNVGGYVYCVENPVKFVDPDGRYPVIRITKQLAGNAAQRVIGWLHAPRTTRVNLYRVIVTDTEDKNFKMTFTVTRDAFAVRKSDAQSGKMTNVAFEPKDGEVNHFIAKVMPDGYPKGNGTLALKLTQNNSEVMHAEPNEASVELGYRQQSDVAAGVMLHVGGVYGHKDGSTSLAASEGCFGITNGSSSESNPSNGYSNSILSKIIHQANQSQTNKGKIEVVIEKRNSKEKPNTKNR